MVITKIFSDQNNSLKYDVPKSRSIIRQPENKDAETGFILTRSQAEYHGKDSNFHITLKDVLHNSF